MSKKQIFQVLSGISKAFHPTPTPDKLEIYAKLLSIFSVEDVAKAMSKLAYTSKFFPSVAEITTTIKPPSDINLMAEELSGRIIDALPNFGNDKESIENLKKQVGATGWQTIQRLGGWTTLLETLTVDLGTLRAQARSQARVCLNIAQKENESLRIKTEKKESFLLDN